MRDCWYVKNCFVTIAQKDEEIKLEQIKTTNSFRNGVNHDALATIIMVSDKVNPCTICDGIKLGSIITRYDQNDGVHEKSTTEFHFYDTLIRVVTYKDRAPNDKQIAYIANYC